MRIFFRWVGEKPPKKKRQRQLSSDQFTLVKKVVYRGLNSIHSYVTTDDIDEATENVDEADIDDVNDVDVVDVVDDDFNGKWGFSEAIARILINQSVYWNVNSVF